MRLNFMEAYQPLRKTFGDENGQNLSYPRAATFTSHSVDIEMADPDKALQDYEQALRTHAVLGNALYKGGLTQPLVKESRKGKTDKQAFTQFMVLDIDGLGSDFDFPCNEYGVEQAAEHVISKMPQILQTVSYVAVASSSFGRKKGAINVHIHFLLRNPVESRTLKTWLEAVNYTSMEIYNKLELTNSLLAVKSVVDPCLAEPARLIYITPPEFGPNATDPFNGNYQSRIVLKRKMTPVFDLQQAMTGVNVDAVRGLKEQKLKELQKERGVTTTKRKYTTLTVAGQQTSVVANPESVHMELAYEDGQYIRYNLLGTSGSGDSNAYWVHRANPEVVYCFKPDEKPFLFREADPEAYSRHIQRFGETYEETVVDGKRRQVRNFGVIDYHSDLYYGVSYDFQNDELIDVKERKRETLDQWLIDKGVEPPENLPYVNIEVRPETTQAMFDDNGTRVINRFRPPALMREAKANDLEGELTYGGAHLLQHYCPYSFQVMYHMLGSDDQSFEHFVNWLAYIFQTRSKAETAWLLHGTEGTGKGLFFKKIIRPLFGTQHARQNTIQNIADDQFNTWMEEVIFLMVDEFNSEGAQASVKKVENQLKNLVTEPTFQIRGMRRAQVERPNFLNIIFATNDIGSMAISEGNRRYNIPPRQERKLEHLFSRQFQPWEIDIDDGLPLDGDNIFDQHEFDAKLDAELVDLSDFLNTFMVDMTKVRTILRNEAALEAREAGMNAAEKFFDVLKHGDFEFLSDILFKPMQNAPDGERQMLQQVKQIVTQCVASVNTGDICSIRTDDIRLIYSYLAGRSITQNGLGRMLKEQNVPVSRSQRPLGNVNIDPTRPRCVPVTWYCDEEMISQIREQLGTRTSGKVVDMGDRQSNIDDTPPPPGLDSLPDLPEKIE